jgi:hypothetical protein
MNRLRGAHKASTGFSHCRIRFGCCAAVLIVVFACLPGSNLSADDLVGSNLLQQTHALCQQSFRKLSNSNQQENFSSFRKLLPALAAAEGEVRGSTPEEKTLLRVAREAGARPALFDELLEQYGHWHGTDIIRPHVLRPPDLQPAHTTETHRAAWEALLIAPPSHEIVFMQQRFTITRALSQIGNPESLPVLELAFILTCEGGVSLVDGSAAVERQFRIMESLNRFTTRESLQAMLRCLGRAEAATSGQLPKYSGYDLREWVVRFLTNQDNYETGEKWRQVLKSFPSDKLPANQRDLLERAIRHSRQ